MKLLSLLVLGVSVAATATTQAPKSGEVKADYNSCLPGHKVAAGTPAKFSPSGELLVDWSNPNLIATRRVSEDVVQIAYLNQSGLGKFVSVDDAIKAKNQAKDPKSRPRSVLTVKNKDGRPFSSTIAQNKSGTIVYQQQQFEYDKDGRCRVGKEVTYSTKDGKLQNALVTNDAALCDKIANLAKKTGVNFGMCTNAIKDLAKVMDEHTKSYKEFEVDLAKKKSVEIAKIDAGVGSIDPATGEAVAVDPKGAAALMRKVAECKIAEPADATEKPLYGSDNFQLEGTTPVQALLRTYDEAGSKGQYGAQ